MQADEKSPDVSKLSSEPPANRQKFLRPRIWAKEEELDAAKAAREARARRSEEEMQAVLKSCRKQSPDTPKASTAADKCQAPPREQPQQPPENRGIGAGQAPAPAATASLYWTVEEVAALEKAVRDRKPHQDMREILKPFYPESGNAPIADDKCQAPGATGGLPAAVLETPPAACPANPHGHTGRPECGFEAASKNSREAKAVTEEVHPIDNAPTAEDPQPAPLREQPTQCPENGASGAGGAPAPAAASAPPQEQPGPVPGDPLSLEELVHLVRQGRREFIPQLREALKSDPQALSALGDLTRIAEDKWIEQVCNHDAAMEVAVRLEIEELKAKLAPSADPLEKRVADSAAIWFLQTVSHDILATCDARDQRAIFVRARLQEIAQRCFLRALGELGLLRKLQAREGGRAKTPRDAARAQGPTADSPAAGNSTKPEMSNSSAGASESVPGHGSDGAGS